jgi:Arylsulfotransferase (ASST)
MMSRGKATLAGTFVLLLLMSGAGAARASAAHRRAHAPVVSVFPIPGDRVATPQTQIAFRGVAESRLGRIRVVGSRSGRHAGRLEADSDGNGASFIPSTGFSPGETVTVSTSLNVLGATGDTFRFVVARPAPPLRPQNAWPAARVHGDVWRFKSRPDLVPPAVKVLRQSAAESSEDIFLTPQFGPLQNGPEIIDPTGRLIWFLPVPWGWTASDLQVQQYQGRPVLTWWQGRTAAGTGVGEDIIYDSSYRPLAALRAGNGLAADLHEFQITPRGSALITSVFPVEWNVPSGRRVTRQVVFDSVVQEIDIPTGLVLFQWDSLDHVPLGDSYQLPPPGAGSAASPTPFDYFHLNSIQLDGDGNLLIAARNTWAAYKLDHRTGAVLWTLGGKHSSFRMGAGTRFAFEHDVRSVAPGDSLITLFDDGAGLPAVHKASRGIELALDVRHKTARLAAQWLHSPHLLAEFEGNLQQLPDGNHVIGWGQQPYFTEYDPSGQAILDARFVSDTSSYRAYGFPWTATPAAPPAIVASNSAQATSVFASWNGATNVASWRVLAGASPSEMQPVETVPDTSFETAINLPRVSYVAVEALDAGGNLLASSATVQPK